MLCLHLFVIQLVSGHLHLPPDEWKPGWQDPEMMMRSPTRTQDRQERSVNSQGNLGCQEGFPLGFNYVGGMNVTVSGRTCQVWTASEPHVQSFTFLGEHNHCRNPDWSDGLESGAIPLTLRNDGSPALSQHVMPHVRGATRSV